jgi:two-component system cell cycle response regulator
MSISKQVLVVDDNAANAEVIHEILDGAYDVIDAANGWEALEISERVAPAFVLLDIMLPIIDGYEVCRKMREQPRMARSRIILVSAKAMPSERKRGLEAGADGYLTKPFDDEELLSVLQA